VILYKARRVSDRPHRNGHGQRLENVDDAPVGLVDVVPHDGSKACHPFFSFNGPFHQPVRVLEGFVAPQFSLRDHTGERHCAKSNIRLNR